MNSRERVLATLTGRQPDRPPRDLGSTTTTGIHPNAYQTLKRHLGLTASASYSFLSARAQLARVEAPVIDRFGIDFLPLIPESAAQPPVLDERRAYMDRWGVERRLPEAGGHYYVTRPPLARAERITDVAAYAWPEPITDFSALAAQARQLRCTAGQALVLNPEAGFLHQAQFLRGFDLWLMDLATDRALAEAVMDRALEVWLIETEAMLRAIGDAADIVLYADDIAFQNQTMFSPNTYRTLIKPRQRRVFDLLKGSGLKVLYHSCGNVWPFIDDLVEMGMDALNPVQVSATNMGRTAELKRRWGDRLTFWGGIDTQHVLPAGTPDEVRAEVWRRLDDLAAGGGYVLAAVHDIQAEVPPANVCALFDAADGWAGRGGGRD